VYVSTPVEINIFQNTWNFNKNQVFWNIFISTGVLTYTAHSYATDPQRLEYSPRRLRMCPGQYFYKHFLFKTSLSDSLPEFFNKGPLNTTSWNNLILPRMNTENGKMSYYYQTTKCWNSLPSEIQSIRNIKEYESSLRLIIILCRSEDCVRIESRIFNCYSIRTIDIDKMLNLRKPPDDEIHQ